MEENDVDPGNRRAHIELMTPAPAPAVAISTRFPPCSHALRFLCPLPFTVVVAFWVSLSSLSKYGSPAQGSNSGWMIIAMFLLMKEMMSVCGYRDVAQE